MRCSVAQTDIEDIVDVPCVAKANVLEQKSESTMKIRKLRYFGCIRLGDKYETLSLIIQIEGERGRPTKLNDQGTDLCDNGRTVSDGYCWNITNTPFIQH